MRLRTGGASLALLALLGCAEFTAGDGGLDAPAFTAGTGALEFTTYTCEDGTTVSAAYPTEGNALLRLEGREVEMRIAMSASGARYTGGGLQWWTNGMTEGTLTPLAPGEEIASGTGVACRA